MEGDNKVKIKEEPIESEDLFFRDTEGRENFYKPYQVENENFVKKEFDTDIKEFDTEISIKSEPDENDINSKIFITAYLTKPTDMDASVTFFSAKFRFPLQAFCGMRYT